MNKLILTLALSLVPFVLQAANFSGKWVLEIPRTGGGPARVQTLYLTLNQVSSEITGELAASSRLNTMLPGNTEIWDAKVEGDTISFYVWSGQDQVAKVFYKGTLKGEEISFTITGSAPSYNVRGERNPAPGPRQAVAKRAR